MTIGRISRTYKPNPDPRLHYKLDPGEPGLALPARASQSVGRVASHELTNLRRFEREALEEGGVVVQSSIHLNLQQKGAFLAATSGKSKARVLIPEKESREMDNSFVKEQEGQNSPQKALDEESLRGKFGELVSDKQMLQNSLQQTDLTSPEAALSKEISALEDEKIRLEKAETLFTKSLSFEEDTKVKSPDREKLDRIDARLTYLKQLKEAEKMEDLYSGLSDTITAPLKQIGLSYAGGALPPVSSVDLFA